MPATMTLIGLYDYNPNLFEFMDLPEGIDKDTVCDNILLKSADFEVLYADPDFVHDAIKVWSAKWYRTFSKWYEALQIEYDPLHNYDRTEEWTDSNTGSSSVNGTTTDETHADVKNRISAYNSNTMQPDTESESDGSSSSTLTNTNTSQNTNIRNGRAYGNIGVTTSQQMLQAELDIAVWNLYDHIADVFLQEFVIPVY